MVTALQGRTYRYIRVCIAVLCTTDTETNTAPPLDCLGNVIYCSLLHI